MDERSMRSLNLAFRFVLEMLALLAVFLLGFSLADEFVVSLVLGVSLVALVMIVWGLFVAPKAARRLEDPTRLAVELSVWLAGVVAFGLAVSWVVAILFGLAVLVSLALMFLLGQRGF